VEVVTFMPLMTSRPTGTIIDWSFKEGWIVFIGWKIVSLNAVREGQGTCGLDPEQVCSGEAGRKQRNHQYPSYCGSTAIISFFDRDVVLDESASRASV
jgi:hypothetical protein